MQGSRAEGLSSLDIRIIGSFLLLTLKSIVIVRHYQVVDTCLIVNASARPPRLAGLPTVGTCNYRYTGI